MRIGIGSCAHGRDGRDGASRRRGAARGFLAAAFAAIAAGSAPVSAGALETVTRSFPHKGTEEGFVVPAGVETIHVLAIGGGGGPTEFSEGGLGGVVEGELHVTPGATLYVEVGTDGLGGGRFGAGTGGTSSDVRSGAASEGLSPDDRLIVAGAGGGAGQPAEEGGESERAGGEGGSAGAEAGEEGAPGTRAYGGGGGTASGGGEAGQLFEFFCAHGTEAQAGSLGSGGLGGYCVSDGGIEGGSGGGGYYGGGGGASGFAGGGGGGGSSLVPAGGSFRLAGAKEQPQVQISYAQPLNPPAVVTGAATELRRSTATLNATVNPEDSGVTACRFEYGTTEAYGTSVACPKKPGNGIAPVAESTGLTGLTQETTYHYRIVATNGNGTSYGADVAFTTHPHEPPHVTAVTPNEGPTAGGETVTITGTELEEATAVTFNGHAASSFTVESPEQITAVTPAEPVGAGEVLVTTPSGTSQSGVGFTVLALPVVKRIAPSNGPSAGGTTVQIYGSGFLTGSEVSFGATPAASVSVVSEKQITAVSPAGLGTVSVSVTVPHAGTSAASPAGVFGYESGAPEFGRCLSAAVVEGVTAGGSIDSKCKKPSPMTSGKYQWEPGVVKTGFTGATGPVSLETTARTKVSCTTATIVGSISGAKGLSGVAIRFTGCATTAGACTTAGHSTGEIATSALEGTLGWESKARGKMLIALSPASGPFATYACAGATGTTTLSGSVLVPFKSGTMASTITAKAKASHGLQKPQAPEGGAPEVLSSTTGEGPPLQTGLTLTATLHFEEILEVDPEA